MSVNDFKLFQQYIHDKVGITIDDHKKDLLRNRLKKRLISLNIDNYSDYYEYLKKSNDELSFFISSVTTNITSFFREPKQWVYLKEKFMSYLEKKGDNHIRIWSAGCATGEEPYSISIFLYELLGEEYDNYNISILATDISERALSIAKEGKYIKNTISTIDSDEVSKYFNKNDNFYQVKDELKHDIHFKIFNLIYDTYPPYPSISGGKFDMIFCRNVMIYFDSEYKHNLINRFISLLPKNGHLFIGHSESLMAYSEQLTTYLYGIYTKR